MSTVEILFLNFSKNGSDGVVGVPGIECLGGSGPGGMTRSWLTYERSDGDGVRAMTGWVGVTLLRVSCESGGVVAERGECWECGE